MKQGLVIRSSAQLAVLAVRSGSATFWRLAKIEGRLDRLRGRFVPSRGDISPHHRRTRNWSLYDTNSSRSTDGPGTYAAALLLLHPFLKQRGAHDGVHAGDPVAPSKPAAACDGPFDLYCLEELL